MKVHVNSPVHIHDPQRMVTLRLAYQGTRPLEDFVCNGWVYQENADYESDEPSTDAELVAYIEKDIAENYGGNLINWLHEVMSTTGHFEVDVAIVQGDE